MRLSVPPLPRLSVGLLASTVLAFPVARAQAPTAPDAGASKVIEELVVEKRLPGPAIWKAAKPDAELYILGAVRPMPHLQAWDTVRTENAIDNAVVVLLLPAGKVGMFDLIGLGLTGGGTKLPGGRTLQAMLNPVQKRRFEKLLGDIHQDWKRYEHLKPGVAGLQLIADFHRAAGLSDAKPGTTVERLAKAHGTPSRPVAEYRLKPMLGALTGLSDAAQLTCFDDALEETEYEAGNAVPAAKAWAEGDLGGVRAHYTANRAERCLETAPSMGALLEKLTVDTTTELKAVLNRPGKTVVVVDLALLLRANGVLDRLKADGAEISIPQR